MKKIVSIVTVVALGVAILASSYTDGGSKEAVYAPIGPAIIAYDK